MTNTTQTDRKILDKLKEISRKLERMILLLEEKPEVTDAGEFLEMLVDKKTEPKKEAEDVGK